MKLPSGVPAARGPERRRQRGRHRRPISRSRRATWFALRLSAAPLPASSDPDGDDDHDEPDHRNAPRNRAPRPLRPVSPRAVLYKGSVGRRPRPRAESLAAPAHPLAVSGAVVSTPSPRLSPAPVSKLFCNFRSSGLASHPRRCRSVGSRNCFVIFSCGWTVLPGHAWRGRRPPTRAVIAPV